VSERLQPNERTRVIHGTINRGERVASPLLRVHRNVWCGKLWWQTILYNLQYYNNDNNIWKTTRVLAKALRTLGQQAIHRWVPRGFLTGRILNNMLFEIMLLP